MSAPRTRSAGAKVNDKEYAQLEALAEARGLPLGLWCREILLAQLNGPTPTTSLVDEVLLSEIIAIRNIILNVALSERRGEQFTLEYMRALAADADASKLRKARERIEKASREPR